MDNNKKETLKATIKNIIVAFAYATVIVLIIMIFFQSKISKAISLINTISIETNTEKTSEVKIDLEHNKIQRYPEYGTKYADIIIEDLEINLPLYYGDTLSILRNGVGQTSGAYFPGEGGSIICMGHNTKGFLRKLPEIKLGTKIKINTVYGNFTYTVYDTKIVPQEQLDAVPVQKDKEILMLYTCYPVNSIGHAVKRFVTYSSLD